MARLGSTESTLFARILRQRKQEAHPDKDPNNAEASGFINNAVDVVAADMKKGGPNKIGRATEKEMKIIKNTVSSVEMIQMDLSFCKDALERQQVELETMQVVAAKAKEDASWWKNWAYEKEAAARCAEGDLERWKEWAYENEAAARHAERDLASWKNWLQEKHEAEQNVLQNQINELKKWGSEAAGVPGAKKARCTYS